MKTLPLSLMAAALVVVFSVDAAAQTTFGTRTRHRNVAVAPPPTPALAPAPAAVPPTSSSAPCGVASGPVGGGGAIPPPSAANTESPTTTRAGRHARSRTSSTIPSMAPPIVAAAPVPGAVDPAPTYRSSYASSSTTLGARGRHSRVRGYEPPPAPSSPSLPAVAPVSSAPPVSPCPDNLNTGTGSGVTGGGVTQLAAVGGLAGLGAPSPTTFQAAPLPMAQVPEPSVLALFGLGAVGLMVARRRRG